MTAGESCAHALALTPGAISVPGDYDGDGIINLGVWIDGWWYIMGSRAGGITAGFWSQGAVRTPMDFAGDGITDIAFFVPERREYYVLPSTGGHQYLVICSHLWGCWAWPYVPPAVATPWWGDPQPPFTGWPRPYQRSAR